MRLCTGRYIAWFCTQLKRIGAARIYSSDGACTKPLVISRPGELLIINFKNKFVYLVNISYLYFVIDINYIIKNFAK